MIRAYDERYLESAMDNLGEMLDYAVNVCGLKADDYWTLFLSTGYGAKFGSGVPKVVSGLSGTELVWEVLSKAGLSISISDAQVEYAYSPEYWSGWILAYYQWYTGQKFQDIYTFFKMEDVLKLYPTLHEASEDKFVDTVNRIIYNRKRGKNIQLRRKRAGLSQRELSDRAGVNLRTLQQYESGSRDINKATAISLFRLAKALDCKIEDILEYDFEETASI